VKNEIEKISVHNVSEDASKHSTMHVRNMLLKAMIIAMQKMHLNEIHFSRDKISQFKSKNLRCRDIEMLNHQDCNIIEKQFNSVVETVNCKQLVSHAIVKVLIIHETTYDLSSKVVVELIKILQQENQFAVKIRADKMTSMQKNDIEA
jgi:ribosomal protein S26